MTASYTPILAAPDVFFSEDDDPELASLLDQLTPLAAELYRTYRRHARHQALEQPSTRQLIGDLAGGNVRRFYHAEAELAEAGLVEVLKYGRHARVRVHHGCKQTQTNVNKPHTNVNKPAFTSITNTVDPSVKATALELAAAEPEQAATASWRDQGAEPERLLDEPEDLRPVTRTPRGGTGSLAEKLRAAVPSSGKVAPTPRAKRVQQAERRGPTGATELLWRLYEYHWQREHPGMPVPGNLAREKKALADLRRRYGMPRTLAFIECYWLRINPDAYPMLRYGRSIQRIGMCIAKMLDDHGIWIAEKIEVWAQRLEAEGWARRDLEAEVAE